MKLTGVFSRKNVRCEISNLKAHRRENLKFEISNFQSRVQAVLVCIFLASLTFSPVLMNPGPAAAQTGPVVQHDFEDGTLQGWIPRGGGVMLTNTTEAAQSGIRSLKTTGRTQGFHGPSLNVLSLLTKGATYQVTASVRIVAGAPPTTVRVTMQRTPMGGSNQFDTIAQNTNVTDSAWVTLTGLYSFTTDVSGLLLYIEATTATASYYVDDFSIMLLAPPPGDPPNTTGLTATFESTTTEGWRPRIGNEMLTVTSADQHSGMYSLLVTNRTAAFQGASIDVTNIMFNGSRYRVSLWAKLAPGESSANLRVSLQRNLGTFPPTFHTVVPNTMVTANQWAPLTAVYDVSVANTSLSLYVESSTGTASFYIDDVQITYMPPPKIQTDIPSVYETLSELFPVGAAIFQGNLTGPHAELLAKHFNSITSENDMKWDALQPTEGSFTFSRADAQVAFAKAHNMQVRGHTLVWHSQVPAWVFQVNGQPMTPTPENKALLLQRLENHIRAVVGRYKDDVYAWDVVNEVIDEGQPDGFRRSLWYQITGTEYIERAFRVAHEVDPDAKLYINDFRSTVPRKRDFLINLARDLRSRGVPIDGIGHQLHSNIVTPSVSEIITAINMVAEAGFDNQITELDMSVYTNSTQIYTEVPPEVLLQQGYRYRDFFQAFRQLKGKISSVTFWGLADDHTWLKSFPITRLDLPLLFDESLQAKPAYWGVVDPSRLP